MNKTDKIVITKKRPNKDKILVENVISKFITPDIFLMNEKYGWLNWVFFEGIKYDPHNVSIKVGQRIESICKSIGQIKYGIAKVPFYYCDKDVTEKEAQEYFRMKNKKTSFEKLNYCPILTKIDINHAEEVFNLSKVKNKYGKLDKTKLKKVFREYYPLFKKTDTISEFPIDLIVDFYGKSLYEIKATGDVDSKSAFSNSRKMLLAYLILGDPNAKLYFAIMSNNKKNNIRWYGAMNKYFDDKMILIEKDFMETILPKNVSFNDFKKYFSRRFRSLRSKK